MSDHPVIVRLPPLAPGLRVGWMLGGRRRSELLRTKIFSTVATATLPQIHISTMNWTDIACGHKGFEGRLFEALTQAQQAQWEGGVLKIIGPTYITLERTGD